MKRTSAGLLATLGVALAVSAMVASRSSGPSGRPNDRIQAEALDWFLSGNPFPVSFSPQGDKWLVKSRHVDGFEVSVLSRASGDCLATDRSHDTQLSLTWAPAGTAVAFQESRGGNREFNLFILDLRSGSRRRLVAPITRTAAFPLRWNPKGDRIAYFRLDGAIRQLVVVDTLAQGRFRSVLDIQGDLGDFAWSPDGQRIAIGVGGAIYIVEDPESEILSFDLFPQGGIHDVRWSPDGMQLLVTARLASRDYAQLYQVHTQTGVASLRASADGDIVKPLWAFGGSDLLYHVNAKGSTRAVLQRLLPQPLTNPALAEASWEIQSLDGPTGKARVLLRPFAGAPALIEIDLSTGDFEQCYPPMSPGPNLSPSPELVNIASSDGVLVPALLWRAVPGPEKRSTVMIEVHGGPHLQARAERDLGRALLLSHGWSILAVDYRGSGGHGARFEQQDDLEGQTRDLLAARRFALDSLHAHPDGISFMGSSFGAYLIANAYARQADLVGPAFLLATPGWVLPAAQHRALRPAFHGFHGRNDDIASPQDARKAIEAAFGSGVFGPRHERWVVLPDEGHHFHRTSSLVQVYAAILRSQQQNVSPL